MNIYGYKRDKTSNAYSWLVIPFGYKNDGSIKHLGPVYVTDTLDFAVESGIGFLHNEFNKRYRKGETLEYTGLYSYPLIIKDGDKYTMDLSNHSDKQKTDFTKFSVFIKPIYIYSIRNGLFAQTESVSISIVGSKYCLIYKDKSYIIGKLDASYFYPQYVGNYNIINDILMSIFVLFIHRLLISGKCLNNIEECTRYKDITIMLCEEDDMYCVLYKNMMVYMSHSINDVLRYIDDFYNKYYCSYHNILEEYPYRNLIKNSSQLVNRFSNRIGNRFDLAREDIRNLDLMRIDMISKFGVDLRNL